VAEPTGSWTEIDLAGHVCDVFEPAAANEHGFAVIYLHGVHLQRLVGNAVFEKLFDRHGLRVLAPRTERSWWTDRICAEFDPNVSAEQYVVRSVLSDAEQRWGIRPPRVALLGTSMGGQGALRLAFKYPQRFPVAAALSPAIDYHLRWDRDETLPLMYRDEEQARQDTAILHVHPLNWPRNIYFACDPKDEPWHTSSERLQMKLSALGIPYECDLETIGGGHGFAYYNHMAEAALAFVMERLERERLRV
jgi:S-formylglutathione hydrolase FrmB